MTKSYKFFVQDLFPYGQLLIDLTLKKVDSIRYYSNSGSVSTKFYINSGTETKFWDEECTVHLYSHNISKVSLRLQKQFKLNCRKNVHSVSEQVFCKPMRRRV